MRRRSSLAANPTLIGAATTLILIIAVLLAYNANSGLPFVRTYDIDVELRNAQNVVPGNDVRLGGARIGQVSDVVPKMRRDGSIVAVASLHLDQVAKPLPADTTVLVRPRSALGLKYIELTRGHSRRTLEAGATIPLRQATPEPVDVDQVTQVFDERTRRTFQENNREFGNAFAGRGEDLGAAVDALSPLLQRLVPVMGNLADPRTQLVSTIQAFARTAGEVAPVAETQASLIGHLDATLGALATVARPYVQDAISEGVPLQDAVARELPTTRPFLNRSRLLLSELRPGLRALRAAAPDVAAALQVGTRTVRRVPALDRRLRDGLRSIERLSDDPLVPLGLQQSIRTSKLLQPILTQLTPTQVTCNYVTLFAKNLANHLSEGNRYGTWERALLMLAPDQMLPSATPAGHLHYNAYPNTGQPGAPNECESGNEGFVGNQLLGNVPGNQGTRTDRSQGLEK
ncbi:Long-chain-fatty-acid--CoA ligase [Patulibacter medicamentivorans]|uniref:Long-chain-fatty-acid--CoA ligase n=1 Tax=Patulibacter medicamentivorans TaxID=1097667 RepID=H0E7H9_9ACTN|nr:MlaD family protein [Patulibacter medicamentivorans]EHN10350.1 Long-chain-fatty-acid--CoA ligase [Patulibacter medicamentivorans]